MHLSYSTTSLARVRRASCDACLVHPLFGALAHHLSGIVAILDESVHFPSALQPFASVLLLWHKDRDNSTRSLLSEVPKLRAVYFNAIGQARNADILQWARDEFAKIALLNDSACSDAVPGLRI